jgi:hypothetical protein
MDGRGIEVGSQMRDRWIGFVNGEGWCKEGMVLVIGDERVREVEEGAYDGEFRGGRGDVLVRIGMERLWEVAERWQGVRVEQKGTSIRAKL